MTLYLDLDGILTPLGCESIHHHGFVLWSSHELFMWRPHLIEALQPHPDVRIVISSSWRFICTHDELRDRVLGPVLAYRFAGTTDERHRHISRVAEILDHAQSAGVTQWLALDDDRSVREQAKVDKRFIYCPPRRGLSSPAVQKRLREALLGLRPA